MYLYNLYIKTIATWVTKTILYISTIFWYNLENGDVIHLKKVDYIYITIIF